MRPRLLVTSSVPHVADRASTAPPMIRTPDAGGAIPSAQAPLGFIGQDQTIMRHARYVPLAVAAILAAACGQPASSPSDGVTPTASASTSRTPTVAATVTAVPEAPNPRVGAIFLG